MLSKRRKQYFVDIAKELDYSFVSIEKIKNSNTEYEISRILEYERIASIDMDFEELTGKKKKNKKWF